MKKYQLPYGNGFQEVTLPEEKVLYDIHGNKADVQEDIAAATWPLCAVQLPASRCKKLSGKVIRWLSSSVMLQDLFAQLSFCL